MSERLDLNDLLFLHKIIYNLIPVDLPNYLSFFVNQSRLRSSHLDHLSLVSSITPKCSSNVFANSFYYRVHCKWNRISLEIREIECHQLFKVKLIDHLWKSLVPDIDGSIEDDYDILLDSG